jgi:transposase
MSSNASRSREDCPQNTRRIVQEAFEPGASVARVAQRHAINANQLFQWRKLYREGLLGENNNSLRLLPVSVSEVSQVAGVSSELPPLVASGTIQVELPKGHLQITGRPDAGSLRVLLECMLK